MSMGNNTYTTQVAYYPQEFSSGGEPWTVLHEAALCLKGCV